MVGSGALGACSDPMSDTVKRAFELAPECGSIKELSRRLTQEGHDAVHEHLQGSGIKKELQLRLGSRPNCGGPRFRGH